MASLVSLTGRLSKLERAATPIICPLMVVHFISGPATKGAEIKSLSADLDGEPQLIRGPEEKERAFMGRAEEFYGQRGINRVFAHD